MTYQRRRPIHSDEGLMLETSVFESFTVAIYIIDLVVDNLLEQNVQLHEGRITFSGFQHILATNPFYWKLQHSG